FAAGDDLHHLALLSENEPLGFQIVLKIAHFPVALHIGPVHFIRDLDKLAANPYSFFISFHAVLPPISLNCEKFRLAGGPLQRENGVSLYRKTHLQNGVLPQTASAFLFSSCKSWHDGSVRRA